MELAGEEEDTTEPTEAVVAGSVEVEVDVDRDEVVSSPKMVDEAAGSKDIVIELDVLVVEIAELVLALKSETLKYDTVIAIFAEESSS